MAVSLWFWGCLRILNFIVIGQYTINIPEIFQEFDSNTYMNNES